MKFVKPIILAVLFNCLWGILIAGSNAGTANGFGGGPVAKFKFTGHLCISDTIRFVNESTGYKTLMWDFGDGTITWDLTQPIHLYHQAGAYTIKLKAIAENGVSNTFQELIIIQPLPSLTLIPNTDLSFFDGESRQIEVQGSYEKVVWYKDKKFINTGNALTVEEQGNYICEVTDNHSCVNTKSFNVIVNKRIIPVGADTTKIEVINNILTPNGDGYNDYLLIAYLDIYIAPVEVYIYNIWGDVVFHSLDYRNDEAWDGTYNGKQLDAGTYYYVINSAKRKGEVGYIDIVK